MNWHVLDIRATWVQEFTRALAKQVALTAWLPEISWFGRTRTRETVTDVYGLPARRFPLQRGFSKPPISRVAGEGVRIARRLALQSEDPAATVLLITFPQYVDLARQWPGPIVYYATDMYRFWEPIRDRKHVERVEREACRVADVVCPNSQRIADYMHTELGVPKSKLVICPSAVREENLLPSCPNGPCSLPSIISDLPRPIAGVVGNLAANLDWELLANTIDRTPWLSWAFVGPTEMPVSDEKQCQARARLMRTGGRVRFVGWMPAAELRDYARAVDVAVLPYRRAEPTYSGSSTKYYEHLAACRPMLSTRGFAELLSKEPFVKLLDTADQFVDALEQLREYGFRDGQEMERWSASQQETWEERAERMRRALDERLHIPGRPLRRAGSTQSRRGLEAPNTAR